VARILKLAFLRGKSKGKKQFFSVFETRLMMFNTSRFRACVFAPQTTSKKGNMYMVQKILSCLEISNPPPCRKLKKFKPIKFGHYRLGNPNMA